ncbi:permease prefix domain 1-containing protein [Enterococcus sp.]|uniref:permease prefix domain 1-containing protein n=1 Tax=Enterococcus sp. TaxID=35783 RepID=UPI0028A234D3|nr:permease prefix domain 1-containing protein [Enterococcus sp.]
MKTIHDYLDSLFLNVPITPETRKAKEDLSAIMEDHYHELISQGKSEHEAIGAVISEFGSVDELLQALDISSEASQEDEDWTDALSEEESFDYWQTVRYFALYVSTGIGLCIASLAIMSFLLGQGSGALGVLMMLVFGALGVGFILSAALKYAASRKKMDDRFISKTIKHIARQQLEDYEKSFRIGLVLGIGLCIFSLAPVLMSSIFYYDMPFGVALFLLMVAVGVFFIVYVSVIRSGYAKLVNETYFIRDEDQMGHRASKHKYGDAAGKVVFFHTVYWPVILVVYFIWSFVFHAWAYSWLIFVVGGILQDFFLAQVNRKRP